MNSELSAFLLDSSTEVLKVFPGTIVNFFDVCCNISHFISDFVHLGPLNFFPFGYLDQESVNLLYLLKEQAHRFINFFVLFFSFYLSKFCFF